MYSTVGARTRSERGPDGTRTHDLTLRKRPHYPSCATGPIESPVYLL